MELVVRAAVVYLLLFVLLRAAGNRQFSELTAFDAVLIIIISEATQQALLGGQDFSVTAAFIVIVTFIAIDIGLSELKRRSRTADLVLEGVPTLLINEGQPVKENMTQERVDIEDIMAAARERQGIQDLAEIRFAVLERDGVISIIPRR